MPKYSNAGTETVTIGDLRLAPGETKSTLVFIPGALPANITEAVAITPTILPIISSVKLTTTTTVTVPETFTDPISASSVDLVGNYLISVYVGTGECTVQLNGAGTAKHVGLYETYSIRCLSRTVDTLVVTISSGTVYVTIESI